MRKVLTPKTYFTDMNRAHGNFFKYFYFHRFARLGVFCYSILLHALVFMVLMKLAYNEAYRRDLASEWHDKYMQHMEDHHHEGNNPMG